MKKLIYSATLVVILVVFSGCGSNQALSTTPTPTNLNGIWSGNGGGHNINWYIRKDGTGIHCEIVSMTDEPIVTELVVKDNQVIYLNTFNIKRLSDNKLEATMWGGIVTLDMKKIKYSPAKCKEYFRD